MILSHSLILWLFFCESKKNQKHKGIMISIFQLFLSFFLNCSFRFCSRRKPARQSRAEPGRQSASHSQSGTQPARHLASQPANQSARQPARAGVSQTEPGRLFFWLVRGEKVQKFRKLKKNVNDTFVFFNFSLIYVLKKIKEKC